ncbi:MAG TPA: trigger factor [Stellaceae bacterium]|nr:trigger factor [Stellaceae bacterium]
MQVTETSTDGLKHEFKIVIPAADISERIDKRLVEIGQQARLPGFRPGKAPMSVLKTRFLPQVRGEIVQDAVNQGADEALKGRNLRPALQPKVEITAYDEGKDLEYTLAIEAMPEFEPMDFAGIALERWKPEVPDSEVDESLKRLAERQRKDEKVDRAAEKGDLVVIDFKGEIDGKEFPGGAATDYRLELGSGGFIPGFEDQLVGAKAGEDRTVDVTFPTDYGVADLSGKAAKFAVTVKEVRAFQPQPIDNSLAEALGMENIDELRQTVREQNERQYGDLARQRLKRQLLDQLAKGHDFPVPPGMVDGEFDTIWKQYEFQRERAKESGVTDYNEGKSDEQVRGEFRAMAERRVRLGLLLSEVARRHNITVAQDEINQALVAEARRFPGQERQVVEYYRNEPGAIEGLRAPILENKVVDHILGSAKVSERTVPAADLVAAEEEDAKGQDHGA